VPKSILVDPSQARQRRTVSIAEIPVNQYEPDPKAEIKEYGTDGLVRSLYQMLLVREFETMLNQIKTQGSYAGIEYNHRGPAHLSIGQESTAVGAALALEPDDLVFGSHRSHGEILAKCFSAIDKLDEEVLQTTMEEYLDGETLRVVQTQITRGDEAVGVYDTHTVRRLAEEFVLYGTLAEIFARRAGFNRGLGGSMHAFFAPFGSMPNNAIVGGSADIAVGAGLYKRINRKPGIVVANIGDASLACGPVWEAITLASMSQYRTLWPKEIGGAPPVLFSFINNFYGMGGQTSGETMGFDVLARVGAGVNPENMHAERVDGYNPLAVADAMKRKRALLLEGKGPALLDLITYRLSGHSPSDASSYRSKEEVELWRDADPIRSYGAYLEKNKVLGSDRREELESAARSSITRALSRAVDAELSPRVPGAFVEEVMYSNTRKERLDDRESELLVVGGENPRVKSIAAKERYAFDKDGNRYSKTRLFSYRDALFEAMLHRFIEDPTMVAYGEENRDWGGAFAVYRGLTEALPYHRLFNTSISEGAIVGSGVGYALCGGRAVVELMYCDFLGRAGDEVFNQMSKWQAMSAGVLSLPLILRVSVGSKYGAQHSQDWTSIVAHIPGLKVMFPATPYDAKGMLNLVLSGTDPVVFFESQRLYDVGEEFHSEGVPAGYYEVEEGEPAIRREGGDITIVTVGATLYRAMEAAEVLEAKYNMQAEVIDLRFITPLKYDLILESVKRTGRLVLASDACERGSFLQTVASTVTQLAFDDLDAPPVVVGSRNWITPAAEMEDIFFPQSDWILDAIHERVVPLPGHKPTTVQSNDDLARRSRVGV
jgi:2-oxoisovalerate dehydrogenase E1 component